MDSSQIPNNDEEIVWDMSLSYNLSGHRYLLTQSSDKQWLSFKEYESESGFNRRENCREIRYKLEKLNPRDYRWKDITECKITAQRGFQYKIIYDFGSSIRMPDRIMIDQQKRETEYSILHRKYYYKWNSKKYFVYRRI